MKNKKLNRKEKNEQIKKTFDLLAGVRINQGSFVVKWVDNEIYQVIRRDSKNVECLPAMNLFMDTKSNKIKVFNKTDLCRYDLLIKRLNSIFGEEK